MPSVPAKLVVLDFGEVDGNARLSDVLPAGTWSGEVSLINPLAEAWPLGHEGLLQERAIAEAHALGNTPALAVMGHCSDTTIALELCRALTAKGIAVGRLILFAPVRVDSAFVGYQAARLMTGLGAPQDETDRTVAEQFTDTSTLAGSLRQVLARLSALTRSHGKNLGLDPDEAEVFAEELEDRYQRWLGFLASQVGCPAVDPGTPVDVFGDNPAEAVQTVTMGVPGLHVRGHHCADPFAFRNPAVQGQLLTLLTTMSSDASAAIA